MISKIKNKIKRELLNNPNSYNADLFNNEDTNSEIKKAILNEQPLFVSRIGSVELSALNNYYKKKKWTSAIRKTMENNAGFFPATDENLNRFCQIYNRDISTIDMLGIWYNDGEHDIYNKYNFNRKVTELRNLEPYYALNPWSAALKGKKVLVIHPFAQTIQQQYKNHKKIFENPNVLPEFNLITMKAVQTISNAQTEFKNWFEALEYMKKQINSIDFDVAIIGAGAYGLPLGAHIKQKNKVAIHLGGATQILFGIKGSRWDNHPVISQFYNSYWSRPSDEEKPEGFKKVEKGCYW
ncbi:GT-D fold domain-containing protein [Priestia megaterium]|uniref:GT-D fold domain-containing protein n=1 Tax=Priestia megaterium TaxID=1404 RepID=UPI00366B1E3E